MATSKTLDAVIRQLRSMMVAAGVRLAVINTNPVVASRPRVGRWGVYYNKTYATWLKDAKVETGDDGKITGPLAVYIEQIVEKPKTSQRSYPRGDVDNYAKGPLDLITKSQKLWEDDDQVVALSVVKRFAQAGEKPRTDIRVVPIKEDADA